MSDFEHARSVMPPFTPPLRPEPFLQEDDAESSFAGDSTYQREGLPPGFRMRHDAHYVDQLTARSAGPQVRLVPLRDIDVSRPSDTRDAGALVRSITKYGVLQPLLVRPRAGRFDLIAGSRRLAAAAAAGLTEVPCIVHQVDDVRARALGEADNLHRAGELPAQEGRERQDVTPSGLGELSRSFSAIGSCLHLLADRETALRDRVALDLIRTEVHRAARLVQCLNVISQDPVLTEADLSIGAVLEQVVEGFAPERRLSGVNIRVEAANEAHSVRGDQEWLSVGLSGALGGMLALVQTGRSAELSVRVASTASRSSVMVEIAQQAVTVPTWALNRFFDMQWTDRPGGYQAAAELAAARKVTDLHRGGAEMVPGERGGSRLVLLFPAS